MAGEIKVDVVQKGSDYFLAVKEGKKQAEVPIPGCKSMEEAEGVKQGLLAEIDKAKVAQATKDEQTGNKLDKAA